MIPKIIHHVWPGDDEFRPKFHAYRAGWLSHHPDWSFLFWRLWAPGTRKQVEDSAVASVLANERYTVVVKSDILRLYTLVTYGGIYVDTDMECLKPIDPLLNVECFVGLETPEFACPSIIGATPRHPLLVEMLAEAIERLRLGDIEDCNRRPNEITGPHLLTKLLERYPDVVVHPVDVFYPKAPTDQSFTVHHWNGMTDEGWTRKHTFSIPMRPGDDVFHRTYAPGGSGSGPGSSAEYTAAFRQYLVEFMRQWGIRSVLDYGCGDMQWARHVDWSGIDYVGVDIVASVIERNRAIHGGGTKRFEWLNDPDGWVAPKVDLVIVKDVAQHLPTGEVTALAAKLEAVADHILWIHDLPGLDQPGDIPRGGYRGLDMARLGRSGEIVYRFGHQPDNKVAFLWSRPGVAPNTEPLPPPPPPPVEPEIVMLTDRSIRVIACHSDHNQCGIREYGAQLDRALAQRVSLTACTFAGLVRMSTESKPGDIVLLHYEPALMRGDTLEALRGVRRRGGKIVFCCHYYERGALAEYEEIVDRAVLHRSYENMSPNAVQIPLACPAYTPAEPRTVMRARLGIPAEAIVLTTVGFLSAWKKIPDVVDTLMKEIGGDDRVILQIRTPWPFHGDASGEEARIRQIVNGHGYKRAKILFSTEFLPERDLLDRVYTSDLGFLYYGQNTGSVSAAAKQFIAARCPVAVTASSHTSDLQEGIARIPSLDLNYFVHHLAKLARDGAALAALREGAEREYQRLNMNVVADEYVKCFWGLK